MTLRRIANRIPALPVRRRWPILVALAALRFGSIGAAVAQAPVATGNADSAPTATNQDTAKPSSKPAVDPDRPVVSELARELHRKGILTDGHNDLPWELREKSGSDLVRLDIRRLQPSLHTDIPRLREGGLKCQFWSAYVPVETAAKNAALRTTLEQIDLIHRIVRQHPDVFAFASTADDIERLAAEGKIASLIGVEGGHSIEGSLGTLRMLHALGVRYMTLTHSESLDWADSATDKSRCDGLSKFGEEVVREMNRIGMLVDISHVSDRCMHRVLDVSKAPPIFSHSSARAIADHPRNVPDDVLVRLKRTDGVVMVNFFSGFVVPEGARQMRMMFEVGRKLREQYPDDKDYRAALTKWRAEHPFPRGSVRTVADHIDHIVKVAGIEHVGLGSDFDGIGTTPKHLESVADYPVLTQVLLDRGYKPDDILKILGGNTLRVIRKAEAVSASMQGK